ncbi:MAG: serine/threonine-protein kinase [Polyangiaceae bacterium]
MSSPQPLMNPGAILSGRWQIQDFIGNGETGEVYGVRDMHSTGTFALKLFWPNALKHPEIWSALQQTARTASGLGVEGVARAYDFGTDANAARPFFVAERVSWSSLADRVRLRGPLTPADVASALGVLARALDAAHGVGLVHRDLKPENVFVSPENAHWVRITDFGVALLRSASPPPPGWGGTVGWVAPDAADPNARSTPAMDIFSLGLVTFFALSGGPLHRAARANPIDPGALWQELTAPLDSASVRARELGASLDPAFDAWFQRAVAPTPQMRFTSVGEMANAFEAIARTLFAPQSQNAVALQGVAAAIAQPLIFQPESLPPPAVAPQQDSAAANAGEADNGRGKKRKAAPLFIGGAVLVFALTGLGAFGLYRHRQSVAEEAAAEAIASASAAATALAAVAVPRPLAPVAPAPRAEATAATTASVAAAEPTAPRAAASSVPVAVAAAPAKTAAALVAPKPVVTPAGPAVVSTAKAAVVATPKLAAVATVKPIATAKVTTPAKKKCGSVFIPCK